MWFVIRFRVTVQQPVFERGAGRMVFELANVLGHGQQPVLRHILRLLLVQPLLSDQKR